MGCGNLSLIPGETGAAAVQNIGAYGAEISDIIRQVYCYDTVEEEFVHFGAEECGYGYQDVSIQVREDERQIYRDQCGTRIDPDKKIRDWITGTYGQL